MKIRNKVRRCFYIGHGPSGEALHLGHALPLKFTAELQKALDCWVVIEMSDEEKFYWKDGTLDEFMGYVESNTKDLIAFGFNPAKTFVFSSFKYEIYMRQLIAPINKMMSVHLTNKIFGFDTSSNLGMLGWAPYQIAPAMSGAFPHLFGNRKLRCLVVLACDQTPYFFESRNLAERLGFPKPAIIASKFLVGLQGVGEKASTTGEIPPIFLNDTPATVASKIKRYAFSGGGVTLEEHRKNGGNLSVDVPYIYLYHFLKDEERLKQIAEEYRTGKMLTGEIKQIATDVINQLIAEHQVERSKITQEVYDDLFTIKVQPGAEEHFREHCRKYVDITVKY